MQIIPAIDIMGGQCVRLTKGDYSQKKVYSADPLEVAKSFEDAGLTRLHLVDLDGAKAGHIVNADTLERVASGTNLTIDFGGGVKTSFDLMTAFNAGAQMVTGGSIAVKHPSEFLGWLALYGADKIILGADARNGKIAVAGWQEGTSDDLIPFINRYVGNGISRVICTDISRDGMLEGPAIDLYKEILAQCRGAELIASGGVSSYNDLIALRDAGLSGAIVGKAIYEGKITLEQLASLNA